MIIKDSDLILSADCGKFVKIFDQHSDGINSIQVDEICNKIFSASDDETIKIWNLETGECLKTLNDHTESVKSILIIPNNKFISGSADATIKIWDLNSFECLNKLKSQVVFN